MVDLIKTYISINMIRNCSIEFDNILNLEMENKWWIVLRLNMLWKFNKMEDVNHYVLDIPFSSILIITPIIK